MAFLDKTGLQTLTNKLVQGDAIKVASSKGITVKEVIDNIQRECESVALPNTMTLENRISEFKVGESRDINVSNDIEESKIGIELKGQTYHNLCKSKCGFNAQYPSNFNTQTYDDKIIITRINENNSGWTYCYNYTLKTKMLKPSTVYTLFFKYETNSTNVPRVQFVQGNSLQHLSDAYNATKIKDNIYICKITTLSSFDNKEIGAQYLYFHNTAPYKTGNKITLYKDMILLEGDYSETPIDEVPKYFEDMKSSFEDKVVNINVQGKNLFDVSKLAVSKNNNVDISYHDDKLFLHGVINNNYTSFLTTNTLKKGTYSLKIYNKGIYWGYKAKIWGFNADKKLIANINNGETFSIEEDIVEIKLVIQGVVSGDTVDSEVTVQIEKSPVATSYEPYSIYNYKFDIKEPLRGLPNGIGDEIRNNNGQWELVRKVGQKTLNGTENWLVAVKEEDYNTMYLNVSDIGNAKIHVDPSMIPNIMCNTLPVTSYNTAYYMSSDSSLMCITNRNNKASQSIAIRMLNDTNTVKVLTDWLSKNPITVYYELATYTVTPIDPIEFNISQGATVSINSDISPVSTYDAVLNRAGQIEQGISLIVDLRNRVNTLESIYDSNLIATQYKLDNLKLNYELEREED